MANRFHDFEDIRRRTVDERQSIKLFTRVYGVPLEAESLIPSQGDADDIPGVEGSGINQPRVYSPPRRKASKSSGWDVTIVWYQIIAYS